MNNIVVYPLHSEPSLSILEMDPLYETITLEIHTRQNNQVPSIEHWQNRALELQTKSISDGTARNV